MPGITLRMARPEERGRHAGGLRALCGAFHRQLGMHEAPSLAEFSGRLRETSGHRLSWLLLRRRTARYWALRRSLRRTPGLRLGRRGHSIPVCRRTPGGTPPLRAVATALLALLRRQGATSTALRSSHTPTRPALPSTSGWALPKAARLPHAGYIWDRWLGLSYYQLTLQPLPAVPVPPVPLERAGRRRNGTITARRGRPVLSRRRCFEWNLTAIHTGCAFARANPSACSQRACAAGC